MVRKVCVQRHFRVGGGRGLGVGGGAGCDGREEMVLGKG